MFRNTSIIFVAALVFNPNSVSAGAPVLVVDSIVASCICSTLGSFVESGKIAGVSTLIYEKNKEVYFNAFGFADREAKATMSRNTILQIFSMTKPITGVALMTLYEKGAFRLDDPVSEYAPEFQNVAVAIVGEFFWDGAASTLFWIDPVNEIIAVLFVQLFPFDCVGLHKKFRDAVYGDYSPTKTE